ncbi:MAG: GNAT family N-acetyltransferase [Bryobacteraceae bacterium]|nr:GNAT family N-acetyltransferase [Bryobacteraceae bacterium]
MKALLKKIWVRLSGKEPEAVIVSVLSGGKAADMAAEVRGLTPGRRHFEAQPEAGSAWHLYRKWRREFGRYRIALMPVLFDGDRRYRPMRLAAFLLAPLGILAFNARGERHHLKLSQPIASFLFWRGVPLDRIWLRPWWLWPWRRDRTERSERYRVFEGRRTAVERRRIAVLTPYFPYPLAHGGAVRIYHLLREMAPEFDLWLLSFSEENESESDLAVMRELCAQLILVAKPRYREPRWSTLQPPEAREFDSPIMHRLLERVRRENSIEAAQVEYTYLAPYGGDVLVEHDVTFDLFEQVARKERTLAARWDAWRWKRFETDAVRRFPRVAVMSEKDRQLLDIEHARVIPNGVDLSRFQPAPEPVGERLLFIGSFRHFPNIVAFRFFVEQVWPLLRERCPRLEVSVVAGPDPALYWREFAGGDLPRDPRIDLAGFVRDVKPLYETCNLVLVPTLVSAGTNLKVLEALAMERAVISTSSGCAGLRLEHGVTVWIADEPGDMADAIARLMADAARRREIAAAGRRHAELHFDWTRIGETQRALVRELLPDPVRFRPATATDLPAIQQIQASAPKASQWEPEDYLGHDCEVASWHGTVAGFLVSRRIAEREYEILNVAVDPRFRRRGLAQRLIRNHQNKFPGICFLEVRQSNQAARNLYLTLGFEEAGVRPGYYDHPPEAAIVMRRLS